MSRYQKIKAWWGEFSCRMDWHTPSLVAIREFDGATICARCTRCNRRIGMDSQGNWFAFMRQDPEVECLQCEGTGCGKPGEVGFCSKCEGSGILPAADEGEW